MSPTLNSASSSNRKPWELKDELPLWAAVRVGGAKKKKNAWTGEVGKHYRHAKHKFVVVGVKNGKRVTYTRACDECGNGTRRRKDSRCGKCGGEKHVHPPCANNGCNRVSNHIGADGTRVCDACWVDEDPAENGCPRCKKMPKSARADELCGHCVGKDNTQAKRDAQQPVLDAFRAQDTRLQLLAKGEEGVPGTHYAGLNQNSDYKPFAFCVSPGDHRFACCTAPKEDALCLQAAHSNETLGNTRCEVKGKGFVVVF